MIKKYGIYVLVFLLLIGAVFLIYAKLTPLKLPSNLVCASGNVDGDLIALNTKYAGRIDQIFVQDGQSIKKDDNVAILQSDEDEAQLRSLSDGIASAKASLEALIQNSAITKESVPLEIAKARNALFVAIAQKKDLEDSLGTQKEQMEQDERDLARNSSLFDKSLISQQTYEYIKLKSQSSKNSYSSQAQRILQAQKNIDIARSNLALSESQNKKIPALEANIEAAKRNIASLQASKDRAQIMIDDMTLKSPVDGFVIEKIANQGEVLNPGMVIATLIDPKSLYLKIFVDTIQNGKIKVGDKAVIFLDTYPDKPIEAVVARVAQDAEFTPKEVSVQSDRIQRVYAVHLKPLHVNPLLKLGIPAIGIVSLDGIGLPTSLSQIPKI
ncbi:MAG: HlyD family efflux transporter periplasmic adaptor subunit [Thiovulaceae bacterium]|nr:HlyD family efflux transporter periplasmic adaptor subunit [Sulfurimonadaceae bacterium]